MQSNAHLIVRFHRNANRPSSTRYQLMNVQKKKNGIIVRIDMMKANKQTNSNNKQTGFEPI